MKYPCLHDMGSQIVIITIQAPVKLLRGPRGPRIFLLGLNKKPVSFKQTSFWGPNGPQKAIGIPGYPVGLDLVKGHISIETVAHSCSCFGYMYSLVDESQFSNYLCDPL